MRDCPGGLWSNGTGTMGCIIQWSNYPNVYSRYDWIGWTRLVRNTQLNTRTTHNQPTPQHKHTSTSEWVVWKDGGVCSAGGMSSGSVLFFPLFFFFFFFFASLMLRVVRWHWLIPPYPDLSWPRSKGVWMWVKVDVGCGGLTAFFCINSHWQSL